MAENKGSRGYNRINEPNTYIFFRCRARALSPVRRSPRLVSCVVSSFFFGGLHFMLMVYVVLYIERTMPQRCVVSICVYTSIECKTSQSVESQGTRNICDA